MMPNTQTSLMAQEAAEAPAVVERLLTVNAATCVSLAETLRQNPPRIALTCARGSSDHAATYAKYLLETRLGLITASAAPSVASVYKAAPDATDALCLAISQSGASPDLIATAEAAKARGARLVAMVNAEGSPLAALAAVELPLHAGPERSVAATKSHLAAQAAIAQLVGCWTQDEALTAALNALPEAMRSAATLDWGALADLLDNASSLYVAGRGPGFASAQEIALKFKETCGLHAEAHSTAELRHGPMTLARDGFPVLLLAQDDETRPGVEELARNLISQGAQVAIAGGVAEGATVLQSIEAHPLLQPLLLTQAFYPAVEALSRARGHDPDRPLGLVKVTKTR